MLARQEPRPTTRDAGARRRRASQSELVRAREATAVVADQARAALAHAGEVAEIAERSGAIRKATAENADAIGSIIGVIAENPASNGHPRSLLEKA